MAEKRSNRNDKHKRPKKNKTGRIILIIFLARDHKKRKRARQMRGERFK